MLLPFSWVYGALIRMRSGLYRIGLLKTISTGVPTVSIGNITVGGTGKTPMAAFTAEALADCGTTVCILTRGYGRRDPNRRVVVSDGENILSDPRVAGDEPLELARNLFGKAYVISDADRISAAGWARERFSVGAFVLDDGFQHFRAGRDLDILLIDATNPFGSGRLIPSGILREPVKNLCRADVVVITRANLSDSIDELKSKIFEHNRLCEIFVSSNVTADVVELGEFLNAVGRDSKDRQPAESGKCATPLSESALAFCALGSPETFFQQLIRENFTLALTRKFRDHHFYTQSDVKELSRSAAKAGAAVLLTTAKDAVKLRDLRFDLPCYVVESKLVFDDEKKLRQIICAVLK